jgi:hypothetical protein
MIITRKAIPRRTILRGAGAALALPFLDGMMPALSHAAQAIAKPTKRLSIVYVPNGVVMESWTPEGEGAGWELTPTLQPLAPFRKQLTIVTGLHNQGPDPIHETGATSFLTGLLPRRTQGSEIQAGVSMDQLVAKELGQHTQLASLELALEAGDYAGTCGAGYTCAYVNTICWRGPTTPLPMETNPRVVFERLVGDLQNTSPSARRAGLEQKRSLLDAITAKVAEFQRGLGARDRAKLSEYLESVRDIERRIQRAEAQVHQELPDITQPAGIPASFEEHAKLMFDLQVLAFQTDLTRVITFMVSREYSGRTYPEIGVPDAHHPTSHHEGDPEKLAKLAKINAYHASLFAYYLDKLRSTPDGDGSLLDHLLILYGCGISDGNSHSLENLPVLLAGGACGALRGGQHLRFPGTTPMSNLHVSLLNKLDLPVEKFGRSDGELSELSSI